MQWNLILVSKDWSGICPEWGTPWADQDAAAGMKRRDATPLCLLSDATVSTDGWSNKVLNNREAGYVPHPSQRLQWAGRALEESHGWLYEVQVTNVQVRLFHLILISTFNYRCFTEDNPYEGQATRIYREAFSVLCHTYRDWPKAKHLWDALQVHE